MSETCETIFPKGWLMRDLKAAIKEVEAWPEGMRRAHCGEHQAREDSNDQ